MNVYELCEVHSFQSVFVEDLVHVGCVAVSLGWCSQVCLRNIVPLKHSEA
jgi:hypothetical protein